VDLRAVCFVRAILDMKVVVQGGKKSFTSWEAASYFELKGDCLKRNLTKVELYQKWKI